MKMHVDEAGGHARWGAMSMNNSMLRERHPWLGGFRLLRNAPASALLPDLPTVRRHFAVVLNSRFAA